MNQTGSFKTLDDWLPWLETLSPREIVLGLDRVETVLSRLDLARPELVINVAGTNGKGSSVAMLESLLRNDGRHTGSYTSPHVHRYNERIRIDGKDASDQQIIAALKRVEDSRGDVPLTFFEFGTLAALVAFDAAAADTLILEVGMGGRLDAVNAVEPDACLITNISLDHCAWLGNDVESIALEKAGIMRPGKPVVFAATNPPAAIVRRAQEIDAKLLLAGEHFSHKIADAGKGWHWQGVTTELQSLCRPSLAGNVQLQNAAGVLALVEALRLGQLLTKQAVDDAFARLRLEGRFHLIERPKKWLLDVAHNPGAATVLAESLAGMPDFARLGKVVAVVGMLADKDVAAVVAPLRPLVDQWLAVTVPGNRAESAAKLAQKIAHACDKPCLVADDIPAALRVADESSGDDDLVLVTGSFYIVGPALRWLQA